jgi:hypothetical protein
MPASASSAATKLLEGWFCKRAKDFAVLAHDLLGHFHVGRESRIVRGQAHTIGGLGQMQPIPRPHAQAGKQFPGQDDTGGIADPGDFERGVHTRIITEFNL